MSAIPFVYSAFTILLGLAGSRYLAAAQPSGPENSPSVSLTIPSGVASETIQISYFLVGAFGGYGGRLDRQAGVQSYQIRASVNGKAATRIKMLAYVPGCRIQTFDFFLVETSDIKEDLVCEILPRVILSGQIIPSDTNRYPNSELSITYMVFWAHEFFGIMDGIVTELHLATVSPDANGKFQVDLPDFTADTTTSSFRQNASLHLVLRDSQTMNIIAVNLEPEMSDLMSADHNLRIRPFYPDGLKFVNKAQENFSSRQ